MDSSRLRSKQKRHQPDTTLYIHGAFIVISVSGNIEISQTIDALDFICSETVTHHLVFYKHGEENRAEARP